MKLDLSSFAFGSALLEGGGTPSWGTSLGQNAEYKFTIEGFEDVLVGMCFCSVPLRYVSVKMGKGGRLCNANEEDDIQLASLFHKVYINGIKIKYPFILLLQKESSKSHNGRRSIKYSETAIYSNADGDSVINYTNADFRKIAQEQLGISDNSCWFIDQLDIKNQDELHLTAYIVDKENNKLYRTTEERRVEWSLLIEDKNYSLDELGDILRDMYNNAKKGFQVAMIYVFGLRYGQFFVDKYKPIEIVKKANLNDSYETELSKAIRIYKYLKDNDLNLSFFGKKKNKSLVKTERVPDNLIQFINAIKTRPFVLLAGISGTGKSRIVRQLAKACVDYWGSEKPMNYEMIQVKPNWHDSSELLGYVSRIDGEKFVAGDFLKFIVKAWENPDTPFFLCLDEMNLAPVEQYFAEYLSVIESRRLNEYGEIVTDPILKESSDDWYVDFLNSIYVDEVRQKFITYKGIPIPQNLVVMGTVNMDETTFSFSRKVLDRAMTIEMNEVDLNGGLTEDDLKKEQFTIAAADILPKAVEGKDVYEANKALCDKVIEYLGNVNDVLEGTPFKIAYRTRNEFLIYAVNRGDYAKAMDEMTSMKILSRIEGDDAKMLNADGNNVLDGLKEQVEKLGLAEEAVSLKKIVEMKKRLASGYTSYWT